MKNKKEEKLANQGKFLGLLREISRESGRKIKQTLKRFYHEIFFITSKKIFLVRER